MFDDYDDLRQINCRALAPSSWATCNPLRFATCDTQLNGDRRWSSKRVSWIRYPRYPKDYTIKSSWNRAVQQLLWALYIFVILWQLQVATRLDFISCKAMIFVEKLREKLEFGPGHLMYQKNRPVCGHVLRLFSGIGWHTCSCEWLSGQDWDTNETLPGCSAWCHQISAAPLFSRRGSSGWRGHCLGRRVEAGGLGIFARRFWGR